MFHVPGNAYSAAAIEWPLGCRQSRAEHRVTQPYLRRGPSGDVPTPFPYAYRCENSPASLNKTVSRSSRRPGIRTVESRLFDTGAVVTGGGVSLCIDTTLHLLERALGAQVATETARIMKNSYARAANAVALPEFIDT